MYSEKEKNILVARLPRILVRMWENVPQKYLVLWNAVKQVPIPHIVYNAQAS